MLNFSEKIHRYFKTILHLCPKHLRRNYSWKIRPDFDLKELEIFWFQKICIFWAFFDIFKFHLWWIIFWGSCILHCHYLSPLRVWFVQELVQLIALISPFNFLINMIHLKSPKIFLGWLFDSLSWKNVNFWYFQTLYEQFCLL